MKLKIKDLKKLIMKEWMDDAPKMKATPTVDEFSNTIDDRLTYGMMSTGEVETDNYVYDEEDFDDKFGPVPPMASDANIMQDPFHTDVSPKNPRGW